MVTDLVTKAKQIEYLINSLPKPEPEETQVSSYSAESFPDLTIQNVQALRLKALEDEMTVANEEYIRAVNRASRSCSSGFDVPIHHGRA
jgi:mediator of RNA polymerase II transcription subunit 21